VRDAGEPRISGVTITLSLTGTTPRTVVTGSDGSFSFTAVPFGSYTVSETVPAGFQQTAPAAPGTLVALVDFGHQTVSGLAFGNRALTASISGTKLNDANATGVKDAGEAGVSGVTIRLTTSVGVVVSTTTDTSGNFSFTGLSAGPYVLTEVLPAGSVQTLPGGGAGIAITLTPGQNA